MVFWSFCKIKSPGRIWKGLIREIKSPGRIWKGLIRESKSPRNKKIRGWAQPKFLLIKYILKLCILCRVLGGILGINRWWLPWWWGLGYWIFGWTVTPFSISIQLANIVVADVRDLQSSDRHLLESFIDSFNSSRNLFSSFASSRSNESRCAAGSVRWRYFLLL